MSELKYHELTPEKIKAREKLTPTEALLVNDFLKSARALPKSICIELNDFGYDGEPTLSVQKRITKGCARHVASLRKSSLVF